MRQIISVAGRNKFSLEKFPKYLTIIEAHTVFYDKLSRLNSTSSIRFIIKYLMTIKATSTYKKFFFGRPILFKNYTYYSILDRNFLINTREITESIKSKINV
jgi:hypothetical protein